MTLSTLRSRGGTGQAGPSDALMMVVFDGTSIWIRSRCFSAAARRVPLLALGHAIGPQVGVIGLEIDSRS